MFDTILVPFDGSEPSQNALRAAADLANKYHSRLDIVFVPEPETTAIAVGAGVVEIPVNQELLKKHSDEVMERAKALADEMGHPGEVEILKGRPVEAMLEHADKIGADLIVVGRRGLGTLSGLLMGSVSHKLIALAKCPVMAVH